MRRLFRGAHLREPAVELAVVVGEGPVEVEEGDTGLSESAKGGASVK